jgi:hypothetical protein
MYLHVLGISCNPSPFKLKLHPESPLRFLHHKYSLHLGSLRRFRSLTPVSSHIRPGATSIPLQLRRHGARHSLNLSRVIGAFYHHFPARIVLVLVALLALVLLVVLVASIVQIALVVIVLVVVVVVVIIVVVVVVVVVIVVIVIIVVVVIIIVVVVVIIVIEVNAGWHRASPCAPQGLLSKLYMFQICTV